MDKISIDHFDPSDFDYLKVLKDLPYVNDRRRTISTPSIY